MPDSPTGRRPRPSAADRKQRTRRARWWAVGAGVALLGAVAWGVVTLLTWGTMLRDLPGADVPGEVAVQVEQGEGQVIYVERETWAATRPLDIDVQLEVLDPDGEPVGVEGYDAPVNYRWPGFTGQAHATFDATSSGTHTVLAEGQVDDDTRVSVGPSLGEWPFWQLAGPAVLLLVALIAGIGSVVVWQRERSAAPASPPRD